MLCEVAAPSDATENSTIVPISARVRPRRSARYPNRTPPTPDISSVTVPSIPAVASLKPK